jgi:Mrp family chromosome partitioning ATPase/capsular polysaccharide biosynthesis protein
VRRLPLVLALMIVGGGVGAAIPVHSLYLPTLWEATATVSVPPTGANISTIKAVEVVYFGQQPAVYTATVKALKLKESGVNLRQYVFVTLPKGKAKKPGIVYIDGEQPTQQEAVVLANTFVRELQKYAGTQLANIRSGEIASTTEAITQLSTQLQTVTYEIDILEKKPPKTPKTPGGKSTTTTTTTTSTTTTTVRHHLVPTVANLDPAQACGAIEANGLVCAPSSDFIYEPSSVPAAFVIGTQPPSGTSLAPDSVVNLLISEGRTTTTTTKPTIPATTTTTTATPSTTPTTAAFIQGDADLAAIFEAASATTSTTARSPTTSTTTKADELTVLQANQKSYTTELQGDINHLQYLKTAPPLVSGISLVEPGLLKNTKLVPRSNNPFVHTSVRGATGLLAGLLLGAAIALLLDGLDKRLRKPERAAQVFGLPVLAEIPRSHYRPEDPTAPARSQKKKRGRKSGGPTFLPRVASPYVALVDEPASLTAEAYRRLRVALMFMPISRIEVSSSSTDNRWASNGSGPSEASRPFGAERLDAPADEPEKRQVIMVVSTGFERTRSEVVANLAAAYAEAGERALVVTTTDVRANGNLATPWQPGGPARTEQVQVTTAGSQPANGGMGTSLPSGVTVPPPPNAGYSSGEPTEPVNVTRPQGTGPFPQARSAVTVEEVLAACVPQQIAGVARLQLGQLLRGPGEMATRGNEVLSVARNVADVILVEVPAILTTPDAEALVRACDSVLVVAECYYTRVGPAQRTSRTLALIGAPTVGVALTNVDMRKKDVKKIKENLARPAREAQRPVPARSGS